MMSSTPEKAKIVAKCYTETLLVWIHWQRWMATKLTAC